LIWVHRVSAGLNAELMTEWSGGTVEGVRTVFRGLITSVVTASLVPTASCVRRRAALGPFPGRGGRGVRRAQAGQRDVLCVTKAPGCSGFITTDDLMGTAGGPAAPPVRALFWALPVCLR
jgi:hypothetical protein